MLHRCDRAMIYIFIAATYYPWLMIQDFSDDILIPLMKYFIWVMALLGILYQQIFHEQYKKLEIVFYLLMGIGPGAPFLLEVNNFFYIYFFIINNNRWYILCVNYYFSHCRVKCIVSGS